jgi:hypothetical protein
MSDESSFDSEHLFDCEGKPIPTRFLPDGRILQVYQMTFGKGRLGMTRKLNVGIDHMY